MNDWDLRNVKSAIKRNCRDENEVNLFYFMNSNQLHINNEYIRIEWFDKFSLTNFYKILSMIKNDEEFIYQDKLKQIEIYL